MSLLFICYPGCSTCRRAKAWLQQRNIPFTERNIKEQPPTEEELRSWLPRGGLSPKALFNTSGQSYRALGLKDRLNGLSEEEQLRLLSSDGMLVRRPLLVGEDLLLAGFREETWTPSLTGAGLL